MPEAHASPAFDLPAEYQQLPVAQKIAYLQKAFRQSCAVEPARAVSAEAALQSAAAESKF
jgi:hypothetical protein